MSRRWLTSCLSEYHRSTVSSASFKDTFQSLLRPKAVFPYAMLKLSTLALRRSLANFSFRRGTGGLPTPSHSSRQSPAATDRVTAGDSRGDSQSHSLQAASHSGGKGHNGPSPPAWVPTWRGSSADMGKTVQGTSPTHCCGKARGKPGTDA